MWERLLLMLLPTILSSISPALREFLIDSINHMEANAEKTDNPWDDMFVKIIKALLNIK